MCVSVGFIFPHYLIQTTLYVPNRDNVVKNDLKKKNQGFEWGLNKPVSEVTVKYPLIVYPRFGLAGVWVRSLPPVRKTDWARSDLCTSRQGFLFCQRFITCWSLVCKKLARSPWIFDVTAEQKRRGPPLFIALFLSRYAPAADHLVCVPCRESIQADRFANGDKQFQSKSPRSMGYSCAEKAHSSSSMGWTFKITAWLIWTGHWVFFLDSWTFKCQWICQESTGMISADIHVWPIY